MSRNKSKSVSDANPKLRESGPSLLRPSSRRTRTSRSRTSHRPTSATGASAAKSSHRSPARSGTSKPRSARVTLKSQNRKVARLDPVRVGSDVVSFHCDSCGHEENIPVGRIMQKFKMRLFRRQSAPAGPEGYDVSEIVGGLRVKKSPATSGLLPGDIISNATKDGDPVKVEELKEKFLNELVNMEDIDVDVYRVGELIDVKLIRSRLSMEWGFLTPEEYEQRIKDLKEGKDIELPSHRVSEFPMTSAERKNLSDKTAFKRFKRTLAVRVQKHDPTFFAPETLKPGQDWVQQVKICDNAEKSRPKPPAPLEQMTEDEIAEYIKQTSAKAIQTSHSLLKGIEDMAVVSKSADQADGVDQDRVVGQDGGTPSDVADIEDNLIRGALKGADGSILSEAEKKSLSLDGEGNVVIAGGAFMISADGKIINAADGSVIEGATINADGIIIDKDGRPLTEVKVTAADLANINSAVQRLGSKAPSWLASQLKSAGITPSPAVVSVGLRKLLEESGLRESQLKTLGDFGDVILDGINVDDLIAAVQDVLTDEQAMLLSTLFEAQTPTRRTAFLQALNQILGDDQLDRIGDRLGIQHFRDEVRQRLVPGMHKDDILPLEYGPIMVREVLADTPALEKLRPNDLIYAINGIDLRPLTRDEVQTQFDKELVVNLLVLRPGIDILGEATYRDGVLSFPFDDYDVDLITDKIDPALMDSFSRKGSKTSILRDPDQLCLCCPYCERSVRQGMDSAYLKKHLGDCLPKALAEACAKRPLDPIEFIAHYLQKHQENVAFRKQLSAAPPTSGYSSIRYASSSKRSIRSKDKTSPFHVEAEADARQLQVEREERARELERQEQLRLEREEKARQEYEQQKAEEAERLRLEEEQKKREEEERLLASDDSDNGEAVEKMDVSDHEKEMEEAEKARLAELEKERLHEKLAPVAETEEPDESASPSVSRAEPTGDPDATSAENHEDEQPSNKGNTQPEEPETSAAAETSEPAANILKNGGNAADAAVCMAAALNVTSPCSTGIGGDAFCLFFDAKTQKVTSINGSGRSSFRIPPLTNFDEPLPDNHGLTVNVPGSVAAWDDCVRLFGSGKMSLSEILSPAIHLAEGGFQVQPVAAHLWSQGVQSLLESSNPHGKDMLLNGRNPTAGETMRLPVLAQTLREIGTFGKSAFYTGRIASAIVDCVQSHNGLLSLDDLESHCSDVVNPISTTYGNVRIYEPPPNGMGLVTLMTLNMLEGFDLQKIGLLSADYIHVVSEALKLAFADVIHYVSDPASMNVTVDALLSKTYASKRRENINLSRANVPNHGFVGTSSNFGADTVYLTTIDKQGNACSFIQSNFKGFGTGLVPKGCGFTLHNRGLNFSMDPKSPNCFAPGKRPLHTIIPSILTNADTGELLSSFGCMGGFMQPQGQVQLFLDMVEFNLNPLEALNLPRFCCSPSYTYSTDQSNILSLEEGSSTCGALPLLREKGHVTQMVNGWDRTLFGRAHIATKGDWWFSKSCQKDMLFAAADYRSDGAPCGV